MRRRPPRAFPAALAAFTLALALSACGGELPAPFAATPRPAPLPPVRAEAARTAHLFHELTTHEARWRSLGIRHYRVTVYHTNFRNDNQTERITVRDGVVTERVVACGHPGVTAPNTRCTTQSHEPNAFTVPDIYKLARELAPDPTHHMRLTFDPFTGLPRTLSLHSGESVAGNILPRRTTLYVLNVDNLEVLP